MIVAVFLIIDFFVKKHYQSYDDVIIGKIKYWEAVLLIPASTYHSDCADAAV